MSIFHLAGDILHASDMLDEVFEKYNKYTADKKSTKPVPVSQNNDSLLDFAGCSTKGTHKNQENRAMDDLGDIFLNESSSNNVELLTPVSLIQNGENRFINSKQVITIISLKLS